MSLSPPRQPDAVEAAVDASGLKRCTRHTRIEGVSVALPSCPPVTYAGRRVRERSFHPEYIGMRGAHLTHRAMIGAVGVVLDRVCETTTRGDPVSAGHHPRRGMWSTHRSKWAGAPQARVGDARALVETVGSSVTYSAHRAAIAGIVERGGSEEQEGP